MNSGEVQKKVSEFAGAPSIVLQWNQQVVVSKMGPQLARMTPPALDNLVAVSFPIFGDYK